VVRPTRRLQRGNRARDLGRLAAIPRRDRLEPSSYRLISGAGRESAGAMRVLRRAGWTSFSTSLRLARRRQASRQHSRSRRGSRRLRRNRRHQRGSLRVDAAPTPTGRELLGAAHSKRSNRDSFCSRGPPADEAVDVVEVAAVADRERVVHSRGLSQQGFRGNAGAGNSLSGNRSGEIALYLAA